MFIRVERFIEIEKDENLFQKELCGIPIWIYIRLEVFRMIEAQLLDIVFEPVCRRSKLNDFTKRKSEEKERYFETIVDRYKWSEILIINDKHRMVRSLGGNGYICPTTGWISEYLDVPVGVCSQVYRDKKNINGDNDILYEYAISRSMDVYNEQDVDSYVEKLREIFQKGYGITFTPLFSELLKEQILYVFHCYEYSLFYERLFESLNLKLVVLSSYYSVMQMVICRQARLRGIPVVEVQHGTTGYEHVAYNTLVRWESPKVYDYAIPDYFLCYGQFELEHIRGIYEKNKILPIGNPFLRKVVMNGSEGTIDKPMSIKSDAAKTFLFVAFNTDNEHLEQMAYEWKINHPGYSVIYRFHPEEKINPQSVMKLTKAGIICSMDFQIGIYEFVRKADYVIGTSSTVLYEALAFKKSVAVLDGGKMQAEHRESEKYLVHVSNVLDLQEYIDVTSKQSNRNNVVNYFYHETKENEIRDLLLSFIE